MVDGEKLKLSVPTVVWICTGVLSIGALYWSLRTDASHMQEAMKVINDTIIREVTVLRGEISEVKENNEKTLLIQSDGFKGLQLELQRIQLDSVHTPQADLWIELWRTNLTTAMTTARSNLKVWLDRVRTDNPTLKIPDLDIPDVPVPPLPRR